MKIAVFLLIGMVFGSCFNDGNCLITATNYMHIQFKKETTKTDSVVALITVFFSGAPPDSVFHVNALMNEILLPLDIHSNTTTIVLQRTNASGTTLALDTLVVGYTMQSKVIAKDCGAFTYYQNLKILHTNLKEIKAFSTSLLTDPTLYTANTGNYPAYAFNFSAYAVNYQIFY